MCVPGEGETTPFTKVREKTDGTNRVGGFLRGGGVLFFFFATFTPEEAKISPFPV